MVRSSHSGAPRRDAVMAGHTGDLETAERLVGDGDPAVRCAALGALDRMGALGADTLLDALADPDATVRRRACALAGRGLADGVHVNDVLGGLVMTDRRRSMPQRIASPALCSFASIRASATPSRWCAIPILHARETDCMAGHIGLEL